MTEHPPRIAPVPAEQRVGEIRELLASLLPKAPPGEQFPAVPDRNLPCTVVKNRAMFVPWAGLGAGLREGILPGHDRELVTLRVAYLSGSPYEWAHHSRSARRAGITDDEIERIQRDVADGGWDRATAAKIRTADEVQASSRISRETWDVIAEEYTEEQLIELLMLLGFYWMTAFILNSVEIEVDPWLFEEGSGQ
jgi:alkylhydroperoxidase family enzyme